MLQRLAHGTQFARVRVVGPAFAIALLLALSPAVLGQVGSLYYKEVEKESRIYVFNTPERYKAWESSGDMGTSITLLGRGPKGETVVAENETALDLYLFKHGLEAYDRATPKPAPAPLPTTLKVGDGELKFGMLLQAWYVADDSPAGSTSTSYYGNVIGNNSFLLRRAEFKLSGKMTKSWGFELMLDPAKKQQFTASGVPVTDDKILQDLAVSYIGLPGHEFSIGQKKITITEEGLRSSSEIDFAERARVTRTFSDRRETGLFYRGQFGKYFGAMASLTNGTKANTPDASNDTLFSAARFDFKPVSNMIVGLSGGYGAGESADRLSLTLVGAHFRYDGTEQLPLDLRAEYLLVTKEQVGESNLEGDGFYATAMYTFPVKLRLALRYDQVNPDKNQPGKKISTYTTGLHYMIKGKNINLKFDWAKITEEGRTVNDVPAEDYDQGIVAAQISF